MKNPEDRQTEVSTEDAREPYEAPRLESEELFEVLALACGKIQPVTFNCQRLNRAS
jgi:hypothetical protein